MKQYPLVQVGNPKLRQVCVRLRDIEIISAATKDVVKRLKFTMREVHGIGLAAPQVGLQKQLFVIRLVPTIFRPTLHGVRPYAVFNPEIISASKAIETDWEGCFSVARASLFAKVRRPESIRVRYQDDNTKLIERTLKGLEARIFQHEYDHLYGKVFLEQDVIESSLMSTEEYRAMRQRQADK